MPEIYQSELVPLECPPIEPIEAPLPFENVDQFENWLRERYIPRTLTSRFISMPNSSDIIDISKTECWAIFSADGTFERCCQVYPETQLTSEFEETLRGKILSHNHFTDDSTFSISDVWTWANLQMKEMRAVTESKTFSLKPINMTWPDPNFILNLRANSPEMNDCHFRHIIFEHLARRDFFDYSVTDFSM